MGLGEQGCSEWVWTHARAEKRSVFQHLLDLFGVMRCVFTQLT